MDRKLLSAKKLELWFEGNCLERSLMFLHLLSPAAWIRNR